MDRLLTEHVHEFLLIHGLIGRDQEPHFVVAYSGGRDSTALLHVLTQLSSTLEHPLKITVAYYWHPWRELQADLEAIHQNCKAFKLPWVLLTPNLKLPKTETAARQDRYQQLARLCHDLSATAVLMAHHQDDHIETVLFRVFRGTGVEGLQGIPAIRELNPYENVQVCLARPLIEVSRTEIDTYLNTHQLRFVEDPTNKETIIRRNFIRHELLPRIDTMFPQARQAILKLSNLAEGDMQIINTKLDEIWQDVYDPKTQSLDEIRFNQLALPYQRRVVRRFLEDDGTEIGYKKNEEIINFIAGKNRELYKPALYSLGANRFLMVYRNRITIERPQKRIISPVKVTVPGQVSHRDLRITLSIIPLTPEQKLKAMDFTKVQQNEAYVDLSRFEGQELVLRTRQEGDRITPLGMATPMKLKRFFINRCVPRFQRDTVPLLATDSQVLWAVGIGISEEIRVKDRPTHLLRIERRISRRD